MPFKKGVQQHAAFLKLQSAISKRSPKICSAPEAPKQRMASHSRGVLQASEEIAQ